MSPLQLVPMAQDAFDAYIRHSPEEFAHELARAFKRPVEDELPTARKDFETLLPQGLQTPHNFLYTAHVDGQAVGFAWLVVKQRPSGKAAHIYDIGVDANRRGHGLGRQLLAAVEQAARDHGCTRIELNVFADNAAARALYDSAGYEPARIAMFKPL